MKPRIIYFSLLLLCFPFRLLSQEGESPAPPASDETPAAPKRYYVFSPRVSVTVPHPMANSSFKKSFVGIYEVSSGLNTYLIKGVFLGATYKNALLKITENKIADYNASMYINNFAGKLGADVYIGEKNKVIYSASVAVGQNWTRYSGLVAKDPNRVIPDSYTCTYYEPEMNLFFLIESNFGIGVTVSYSIFSKNFDPYELALNDWTQFSRNTSGNTQYFSFGFGFYYSLWQKKKQTKTGY